MEYLNVPFLTKGAGRKPEDGGCIMQVVDWIDRGGWTDSPRCVHLALASAAIEANDKSDDSERQELLDLIPRLMGTFNKNLDYSVIYRTTNIRVADRDISPVEKLKVMLDVYDELSGRPKPSRRKLKTQLAQVAALTRA